MLIYEALILTALVIFIVYKFFTLKNPPGCPPGPAFVPILGSIPFLPKHLRSKSGLHIPKVFHYLAEKYGKVSCIHLGPIRTILISDGKILREAFRLDQLSSRPKMKPFHELRYGDSDASQRGLFFSSGSEWSEQRKFSMWQLKDLGFGKSSMEGIMLEEVDKLCRMLQDELSRVETNNDNENLMELSLKMNISIVNALWVLLVGEKLELHDEKLKRIVKAIDQVLRSAKIASLFAILFPNLFKHFSPRFANAKAATNGVLSLLRPHIQRRLEQRQATDSNFCFMDAYIDEIERINDKKDESSSFYGTKGLQSLECVLLDMFMGGSETTATSLLWAVAFLIHHPEVQTKIHEELDEVVGKNKQVRLEHSSDLHYLNAVINEILRKAAVAPSGLPHYVTEDVWVSGYFFPKDTNVMANISYIHYDPTIWPEPEKFDPSRFLDENGRFTPSKVGYLPFSVGKRFCPGQSLVEKEFFLFLAGLLQKFEFRAPKKLSLPNISFKDDEINMGFVRQPENFLVNMIVRN